VVFVVVKGVPGYDDLIPLIQEKNKPAPKLWKLVGGTKEPGENLEDTAHREVGEELGISVLLSEDDLVYEAELTGKHGRYDFVIMKGQYFAGEIKLGSEIENIGFFNAQQIREMIKNRQIVKNHADALRACL
jgi:ADP-ribose pyrophosphatase YjhB (NUDIX family)